jgi:hypothetical protein
MARGQAIWSFEIIYGLVPPTLLTVDMVCQNAGAFFSKPARLAIDGHWLDGGERCTALITPRKCVD